MYNSHLTYAPSQPDNWLLLLWQRALTHVAARHGALRVTWRSNQTCLDLCVARRPL